MERKRNRVSVRITDTLKNQVEEKLRQDGITMSELLTSCLMAYLKMTPDFKKVVEKPIINLFNARKNDPVS